MTPKTVLACVFASLFLLALSSACPAAAILVPLQRPTIQSAIDIAEAGDIVLVSPGTYFENIDFKGKAITVWAVHAAQPVIIDGQSKGPVVMFHNRERATSVLYGFTIQHGFAGAVAPCYYDGGGVCVLHASPTIRHNTIIDNIAEAGNGIAVEFGAPIIVDNYIGNNIEDGTGGIGGGIFLYGTTTAHIINNVIENNRCDFGGGIGMYNGGRPTITGNILRGNQAAEGGGVWIANGTDAYIGQNLFTGNSSYNGAAVNWTVPQGDSGPILVNNTIADNVGQAIYASGFDRNALMSNNLVVAGARQTALYCDPYDDYPPNMHDNDVYSAGGLAYGGYCTNQTHHQGNISGDPLFVSAANRDYHLQALSPAIDKGTNTAPRLAATDFDGATRIQDGNLDGTATVDMGIFEYTPGHATGSIAATIQQETSKASRADTAHPSLRRYESVGRDNRRTVQYYDATGCLIAEVDARGVYHRMH